MNAQIHLKIGVIEEKDESQVNTVPGWIRTVEPLRKVADDLDSARHGAFIT
jgi:hypothetical protein